MFVVFSNSLIVIGVIKPKELLYSIIIIDRYHKIIGSGGWCIFVINADLWLIFSEDVSMKLIVFLREIQEIRTACYIFKQNFG